MELKGITWKIPSGLFQTVYDLPAWQKAGIWLLSLAIPIGLFWFFYLSAHLEEMGRMSKKIPEIRQELVKLETKSKQLSLMEKELKAMERILQEALKLLPGKEDIPSVLTGISSLGNEARLDFLSFRPQKEQLKTFYAAIPVKIEFNGPFHNTVAFLDNIGRMTRIVHIKELSMGNARQSTGVWSQSKTTSKNLNSETTSKAGSTKTSGQEVQNSSDWTITTHCQAVTYRFLSPQEQQAQKKHKKRRR